MRYENRCESAIPDAMRTETTDPDPKPDDPKPDDDDGDE